MSSAAISSTSTAAPVTFGGLASGLDTSAIITKLVAVERQPEDAINQSISDTNSQISLLGTIATNLTSLQTATDVLGTSQATHPVTATSNNTAVVSITGSTATSQGTFNLVVNHLAQAQTTISNQFASDTAGIAGVGSIDINTGTNMPVPISWDATDSLTDISNKINAADAGVSSSVLFDGTHYQIMVTSDSTGLANAISFTSQAGTDLGFSVPGNTVVPPLDADFDMNNIHITRSSNLVSDVINGVTFQLNEATGAAAPTTISLAPDVTGLTSTVQAMVTAFNTVATAVHAQTTYTGDGTTLAPTSSLFGDSSMQSLEEALDGLVSQSYSYGVGNTNVGDLGLSLNEDGTLTFDTSQFSTAIASNPDAADHLFNGSGANGFVQSIDSMVTAFTEAGDGILPAEQTELQGNITSYNDEIAQIEDQANALQTQLTAEFSAEEQTTSDLQSQASYLSQIKTQT